MLYFSKGLVKRGVRLPPPTHRVQLSFLMSLPHWQVAQNCCITHSVTTSSPPWTRIRMEHLLFLVEGARCSRLEAELLKVLEWSPLRVHCNAPNVCSVSAVRQVQGTQGQVTPALKGQRLQCQRRALHCPHPGDTFPDPRWVPEGADGTTPCLCFSLCTLACGAMQPVN